MAGLTETLGNYKPRNNYSYSYNPPRVSSPYPQYPRYRPQSPDQNPAFGQAMMQQNQIQASKPIPSFEFQAEYNYDPILAKIAALGDMTIANARSEAANAKKRAFIEAGDADLAQQLGADQNTIDAAKGNTFGTRQRLDRDFAERGRMLDEAENSQNLFYSGHRADNLVDLERGRTEAYTDWSQVLRDLLSNIDTQALRAEEMERQRQLAAATRQRPAGTGGAPPPGGSGGDWYQDPGQSYPIDYLDQTPAFNSEDKVARERERRLLESLGLL